MIFAHKNWSEEPTGKLCIVQQLTFNPLVIISQSRLLLDQLTNSHLSAEQVFVRKNHRLSPLFHDFFQLSTKLFQNFFVSFLSKGSW